MSILSGKTILVIGEENPRVKELEEVLKAQHMNLHVLSCVEATIENVSRLSADLVLLNHLHEGDICSNFLSKLSQNTRTKQIPVFALVNDVERRIQDALMLGAADYITTSEPISSIVEKMMVMFGQPANSSGNNILDITNKRTIGGPLKSNVRVYVVEDDPLLKNLLKDKLAHSGFPTEISTNGVDIIQKIRDFKPAVIVLDLMLPGKDGFEILAEVKQETDLKNIPVIVFSNRDSQEDRKRCQDLGASKFYVKALTDLPVLIEAISDLAS